MFRPRDDQKVFDVWLLSAKLKCQNLLEDPAVEMVGEKAAIKHVGSMWCVLQGSVVPDPWGADIYVDCSQIEKDAYTIHSRVWFETKKLAVAFIKGEKCE